MQTPETEWEKSCRAVRAGWHPSLVCPREGALLSRSAFKREEQNWQKNFHWLHTYVHRVCNCLSAWCFLDSVLLFTVLEFPNSTSSKYRGGLLFNVWFCLAFLLRSTQNCSKAEDICLRALPACKSSCFSLTNTLGSWLAQPDVHQMSLTWGLRRTIVFSSAKDITLNQNPLQPFPGQELNLALEWYSERSQGKEGA